MNMKTAFFLRAYNDIDHIAPVIWKFIKKGEEAIVVFNTDIDYKNDYRIKFLLSEGKISIYNYIDHHYVKYEKRIGLYRFKNVVRFYKLFRNPKNIFGKVYRKLFFDCSREIKFLKDHNIGKCVFEWGDPYFRGIVIEKFFKAAKGLNITTFCLPHGCNIYTNADVGKAYLDQIKYGAHPNQILRREYDYYIFQNPIRRDGYVKWGTDPIKTQAWGSARFCPEWQSINLSICPGFILKKNYSNKYKIVFMDHQKGFGIEVEKIWSLIDKIVDNKKYFLIIKQSTRAGKDYHSRSFREKHSKRENVEFVGNECHSPKLIEWSDCVINYGSSIGLEALIQNKPLINPQYLHNNNTLYEETGACFSAINENEVIAILNKLFLDKKLDIESEHKKILFQEIIYGGHSAHDVLESYYNKITAKKLNY